MIGVREQLWSCFSITPIYLLRSVGSGQSGLHETVGHTDRLGRLSLRWSSVDWAQMGLPKGEERERGHAKMVWWLRSEQLNGWVEVEGSTTC